MARDDRRPEGQVQVSARSRASLDPFVTTILNATVRKKMMAIFVTVEGGRRDQRRDGNAPRASTRSVVVRVTHVTLLSSLTNPRVRPPPRHPARVSRAHRQFPRSTLETPHWNPRACFRRRARHKCVSIARERRARASRKSHDRRISTRRVERAHADGLAERARGFPPAPTPPNSRPVIRLQTRADCV